MTVVIFIIILGILIFVHELGHFIFAKKTGMRVDEFAIGFPPKIFSFKKGDTNYSLNLIPIGGYVKIFGEDAESGAISPDAKDSFVNKPAWAQAVVLVAGVAFNIIFAWFAFFIASMSGLPTTVSDSNITNLRNVNVIVLDVYKNSPAESAGIQSGDKIISIASKEKQGDSAENLTVENIQMAIQNSKGPIDLSVLRGDQKIDMKIEPQKNIIGDKQGIGVSLERIGSLYLSPHKAVFESIGLTFNATKNIGSALFKYIGEAFTGRASLDQVSGPVGIANTVGKVANMGFIYLVTFTAAISINLAILNILPFPALDGGRLVMVVIESITKRRIKPVVVNWVNGVGFALLILLMIVITINDVINLF